MNVYDFDGTIYAGDSSVDFYWYALRTHWSLVRYMPVQFGGLLSYVLRRIDKTEWKERFFSFLHGIDGEALVCAFWRENRCKIRDWYQKQHKEDDVVISASPTFLLAPICEELGIHSVIATRMEITTGKCLGENCKGSEKVRRFAELYPKEPIENFYSDSRSDQPLADYSQKAYFVRNGKISVWKRKKD